jgi:hypothetical protein
MKAITLYLSTVLFLLTFSLQAQTNSERKSMSQGNYEAIVMQIPDLNPKTVSDLWEDFTKDFYNVRTKYNRKTKEYFSDDAEIAAIGKGNTVDIYTRLEEKGNGTELSMWIDLGGAYLSIGGHPDRYLEAEKMLISFGLEAAKEKVRMDIEEQEKALKALEDDLKKMGKDKESLESDIEKARETIARAEQEIEENVKNQATKQQEIEAQQELIDETKKKLKDF